MRLSRRLAALGALSLPASAALAASLTASSGSPLAVESQSVKVAVDGSLATTQVEQVFRNDTGSPQEAIYDFPLPERATFSALSVYVDGKEIQGELVARARAEDVYSDVTGIDVRAREAAQTRAGELGQRRAESTSQVQPFRLHGLRNVLPPPPRPRDPGLLELAGRDLRLRVAPVPAHGTEKVVIRYVEPTTVEDGRGRWVYPLVDPQARTAVAGRLAFDATVSGRAPLARVRCPSHPDARTEDRGAGTACRVTLEQERAPLDRDLELQFDLEPEEGPRLDVAAARDGAGAGTALVSITPWLPSAGPLAGRDVVLVVDTGEGLSRLRGPVCAAVERLVQGLGPHDRFEVVAFDLGARAAFGSLEAPVPDRRAHALAVVQESDFARASDPRTALPVIARSVAATRSPRPLDVVLVTDGRGATSESLVRAVEERATSAGIRFFALELGPERQAAAPVARLARHTGGLAVACEPTLVGRGTKELEKALATPVLRAPRLRFEGVELSDVHPSAPPVVLRSGTPVLLAGRYAHPGRGRAILEGTLPDGRAASFPLDLELPEKGRHPEVARLWAQAAADDLELALARPAIGTRERADLEKELERVSLAGPILSRKTSLLVLESEALFLDYGIERRNRSLVETEKQAEAERAEDLDARVKARDAQLGQERTDVVAMAPSHPELWKGPHLGGGGGFGGGSFGGHGGGAGEPFFLGLAAAAVAGAWRRRRAHS